MARHRLYVIQSTDGKWFWDTSSTIKRWSYGDTLGFAWIGCSPVVAKKQLANAESLCKSKTWRIREFRMAPIKKGKVKRAK